LLAATNAVPLNLISMLIACFFSIWSTFF
jgi:hypothetical protein